MTGLREKSISVILALSHRIRSHVGLFNTQGQRLISRMEITTQHTARSMEPGRPCLTGLLSRSRPRMQTSSSTARSRSKKRVYIFLIQLFTLNWLDTSCLKAAELSHRSLVCGGTRFTITNTYDPDTFIKSQDLKAQRGRGKAFLVNLRNKRAGNNAGYFSFVADWLCHHGDRAMFLELLYGCNDFMTKEQINRYCGGDGTAQWERYIGLNGKPLDQGYKVGDPRYIGLDRRLGLSNPRSENMLRAD